jgi:zinc and cadmium transporter
MTADIPVLLWIVASGVAMSLVALVGSLTLLLPERALRGILLPLVAFAAGSLIGGAFFHMIPASVGTTGSVVVTSAWTVLGFLVFFALEQFLHYHHCHRRFAHHRRPLTYLVLIGDGLHNFLGGLAVAGTFLIDVRLGITTWLAAVAHEIPQELGDFGVLVHGGWPKVRALVFNVLSASTFLLGSLLAYTASLRVDVSFLVPFAAGNFLYIGASDLVPEVNKQRDLVTNVIIFASFAAGLGLLLAVHHVGGPTR